MGKRLINRAVSLFVLFSMVLGLLPSVGHAAESIDISINVGETAEREQNGLATELTQANVTIEDSSIVNVSLSSTHTTTDSSTQYTRGSETTSISSGSLYVIASGSSTLIADGTTLSSGTLPAAGSEVDSTALWTITAVDGGYTISQEIDDGTLYYLNSEQERSGNFWNGYTYSYTLSYPETFSTSFSIWSYSNGTFYQELEASKSGILSGSTTVKDNYYLNVSAGTWELSTSTSDIILYQVTEEEVGGTSSYDHTITFTGQKPGITTVVVGDETYTVSVELPEVNVELYEGQSGTYEVDSSISYEDDTGFDSSIVGVTVNGDSLVFEGLKAGTTSIVKHGVKYNITVKQPTYAIDITHEDDTSVVSTIVIKKVTSTTTYDLNAVVTATTAEGTTTTISSPTIIWMKTSDPNGVVSGITQDGVVSFTGAEGSVQITAYYTLSDDNSIYDTVTFSVSQANYVLPSDGTSDFPEYPNEGAVRIEKTATAVGNFSETGIAMVELAMTGVPFTKGSEVDVVMMLDMTGSMSDDDMASAEEAAIVFAKTIVTNEDGSYNDNRIAVFAFNSGSSSPYELWSLGTVTADTWDSFCTAVRSASEKQASGGTPYDEALEKCYNVLQDAKTDGTGNSRQQFCVFMSDGGPTSYQYITNYDAVKDGTATSYTTSSASASGGANQSDSTFATMATYTHEYYSTLMKDDGVTVYSVGTGLTSTANPNCAAILSNIATDSTKAYLVESSDDTDSLSTVFSNIAQEIIQAATNVEVEDKISTDYSMIFELPTGLTEEQTGGQNFYIQIVEYTLDPTTKERTGDPVVLEKFELVDPEAGEWVHTAGSVVCAEKENDSDLHCIHLKLDEYGEVATIDGTYFKTSFDYDADSQVLTWEADKLTDRELALQYFVLLDNSDSASGADSGTYPTNEYANVTYTNYLGNECKQEFSSPQMTYNGAQASYVFYLVNENGEPVNRAGRVVPFTEAVYVTDVLTQTTTWKEGEKTGELKATFLASQYLPGVYELYDETAYYEVHVFADTSKAAYFIIEGTGTTTKVFNTKAGTRYDTANMAYAEQTGSYTSAQSGTSYVVSSAMSGFDFANTTVAFAVVWTPELVENTVVLDFGLPVTIDVATDDTLNGAVVGVRESAPADVVMNSGRYDADKNTSIVLRDSQNNPVGNAYVVNGTSVQVVLSSILNETLTFYYEFEANYYSGGTLINTCMYSSVTVVPATNVLYEESFITNGEGSYALWESDSSGVAIAAGTSQSDKNKVPYGYDDAYQASTGSSGTQFIASLSSTGTGRFANNISFTFTGTGFDLIGSCSSVTGTLMVRVNDESGNYVKAYMVDTAFLNTDSVDADGKIYQVPLVHEDGLAWGTYTVIVSGSYVDYNGTAPAAMMLEIDGFRVYRTGQNAEHVAFVSGEQGATYVNILKEVETISNAIAYVDSTATGYNVSTYESVGGPENEVYVKPGQSIVLNTASLWHQVSLRSVTETATSAVLRTGDEQIQYDIAHNTEMYYALESQNSGILTITNTGTGLLAVGNVKLYSTTADTATLAAVSAEDLPIVYAMLSRPVEPVFQPEKLLLETGSVIQDGQKFVTLTVTASTDVHKLIVNGIAVWANNYTQVQQGLQDEYVYTVLQVVSPEETVTFEVVASDADGVATETYIISE